MTIPTWPEWGADPDRCYPWHLSTGPQGDMHAGVLLDTVIGPDVVTGTPRIYEILRCEPCIAIHVTPLPDARALASFYAEQFYERDKPDYVTRYEQDRRWWVACTYAPLLTHCAGHMPRRVSLGDRVRYLDIGSGPGIGLDTARALGFQTTGVEPNGWLCQRSAAQGHTMHQGTLETVVLEDGAYDVVMLYEVLEHQPCPDEFVLRVWELLAPGGLLVIVVPNDASPIQYAACRHLGIAPYWWAAPHHLFFWTPKTVQLCLRRCGFSLVDLRGTYPLDQSLLEGHNYLGHDAIGRMVHGWRMADELQAVAHGKWKLREAAYRANMQWRVGREIIAIARKC